MRGQKFLICGLTGWCIEIIFTAVKCLGRRDGRLIGQTSLWMFPIYGMAVCIGPIYAKINKIPTLARGILYSVGIFFCEYMTGSLLKRLSFCPWDYSEAKANIDGLIRLDFAPYWIFTGLLFERILCGIHDEALPHAAPHDTSKPSSALPCDPAHRKKRTAA